MPLPPNRVIDGDTQLRRGTNSINPLDLTPGFYFRAINMLNRGGVLQTRPGYRWIATLPDGVIQGFKLFLLRNSAPQLIAVIGGTVYRSLLPYSVWEVVPGIALSPTAARVYFAQATKSVKRNDDSSLTFIEPVNTLLIQDGINAPAFYDGSAFGHLRGAKTTPIGGPMCWTGERLWVARGSRIYVSDIEDPYSFVEDTYNTLGGRQYFSVIGEVTGMIETPSLDVPQLLVFTDAKTIAFQSNVRERSTWPKLPDFQTTILDVGCVSQRSIIAQHGLLYWMTPFGLVSFDSALLSKHTSQLSYRDNEMAWSKAHLNNDLSGVAGASFENYLVLSVPFSDQFNTHTWVLDFTVRDLLNEQQPPAWASAWTGTRPIEWAGGSIQSVPRIFFISRDDDDKTRVWEAFDSSRRDQDCDIDWAFETRAFTLNDISLKEFRMAEFALSDCQGPLDLRVSWAGATKGRWREIANARVFANEGNIDATQHLPAKVFAMKKQSRLFRTQDTREIPPGTLDSNGIESDRTDNIDKGFQLFVQGNGPCAVQSIRVFLDRVNEDNDGKCSVSEESGRFVRVDGAASSDEAALQTDLLAEFDAQARSEATYHNVTIAASAEAKSFISQRAADKLAKQRAWAKVDVALDYYAPPFIGGGLETPEPLFAALDFSIIDDSECLAFV